MSITDIDRLWLEGVSERQLKTSSACSLSGRVFIIGVFMAAEEEQQKKNIPGNYQERNTTPFCCRSDDDDHLLSARSKQHRSTAP